MLSFLHSMDRVLSTNASEISPNDENYSSSLKLRYDDRNSAWPEQIFDNQITRQAVETFGGLSDLKKYSNTARVKLTLGDDSQTVTNMETMNGHRFQYIYRESENGPMKKELLSANDSFFTFGGGVLTFHNDESDLSGRYEYALVHIPPCYNSNVKPNTRETIKVDEESTSRK